MRILTFNTLFKGEVRARLGALGALLEASDHDVVCLQEVMLRRGAALLRRATPSFRHHAYTGGPLLRGGLVLLSRLPIVEGRFTRYPTSGHPRGEWLMRKGFQSATIGGLVVVNTHLSANRDDDWSDGNRYTRLERAELEFLAARLDPSRPTVVVGDLNVPRNKPVLQDFLAATGLRDVLAGDTRPTYRPTAQFPSPPAFDHVLASPGLAATADLVLQDAVSLADGRSRFLSDHYGVAADVRV
ncbi:endonuclease/exonuclease/phosphatase family protein [Catenuloplanes japonicus]|uniref:endonuclease/exonuclease/phosphatase family protein n=1 Tax=Catenuloplanes japonicus TaxID=33876 RepID=UPI0006924EA9|nr:endonuclease/exonuclease/phosphatase family protein [Catenuloplanes japonicus]